MGDHKITCWIFGGAPVSESFRVEPSVVDFVIAADSGYTLAKRMGITPDMLMGDFDSLSEPLPDDCQIVTVPAEKDDTDVMLAVKSALEEGFRDFAIVGGIGGRLDHTIANIQTLAYILEHGGSGVLIGERDEVRLLGAGEYVFPKREDAYLSLFAYGGEAVVSISGVKYELSGHTLTGSFPLGVSNRIISDNCQIIVNSGKILVIFSRDDCTDFQRRNSM